MIKELKIKAAKFYVTSDLHLGHNRPWIIQARGFETVDRHDAHVIDVINSTVMPDEYLLMCGDFCLNTTLEGFISYCNRISCQLLFVAGNHNNPWFKYYLQLVKDSFGEEGEFYPFKWKNVTFLGESVDMVVNGYSFHASHFPKFVWDHSGRGRGMICGHSHGSCVMTRPEHTEGRCLDVGWDVFHKPLELSDLKKILDRKTVAICDHHGNSS